MSSGERITPINIEEEMKSAYIDYSMSVIVSRALPDVRDGLKPVHRRVLYGMSQLGLVYSKSHKKSARIVGEVLGKYHPHGDSSVYDTMVRMAQHWSLRYPLVDGQGNFGSVDGDSPAAMRYTEARLQRISDELLADLDKDTVDFQFNFDDTLKEPSVLPSKLPHLLLNGASGIAVGMATNMMPHNLTEVIDGVVAYLENNDITIAELMNYITAPDFPTGGTIYGMDGVKSAFETGRGRVVLRGKAEVEELKSGRERIIVTEIPYQVNKASLIMKAADLVNQGKIEGISDIRDESDRKGMRIVFELKRDANGHVVLSKLFKYTQLQNSYGVNNVCLVKGRPELLNLKQLIEYYVEHREEVVTRRTQYNLRKAEERAHIVQGLLAALDRLDQIITLIRQSPDGDAAKEALMQFDFKPQGDAADLLVGEFRLENDRLSERQAKAILDMRLQRLTGLERDKLKGEFKELMEAIEDYRDILAHRERRISIIREELVEIRDRYGDERMTDIEYAAGEIRLEDMIKKEEVVVTISHLGYIKRTPISEYRIQSRGGVGAMSSKTRDEDFIEHLFVTSTHNYLLLFTEQGQCHWLRVYEIPEGTRTSKGRVLRNIVQLDREDSVRAYIVIQDLEDQAFLDEHFILFATRQGLVKKTAVEDFSRPRTNGIIAINIREGDQLLEAKLTNGTHHVFLGSYHGKAIRFHEDDVRSMGRNASGVKGITLNGPDDRVVGMVSVPSDADDLRLLSVSENGLGKRTDLEHYRLQSRGGKGIITLSVTERTGGLVGLKAITDEDDLMIINRSGLTIRMHGKDISTTGRSTQGVRLINLKGDDTIADVALIRASDEDEEEEVEQPAEKIEESDASIQETTEEDDE